MVELLILALASCAALCHCSLLESIRVGVLLKIVDRKLYQTLKALGLWLVQFLTSLFKISGQIAQNVS